MKLDCPKLIAWGKRCYEKDVYEFVIMYRKKIGVETA
jgi:hypothetical protein